MAVSSRESSGFDVKTVNQPRKRVDDQPQMLKKTC